jgi:hypothetical protein
MKTFPLSALTAGLGFIIQVDPVLLTRRVHVPKRGHVATAAVPLPPSAKGNERHPLAA